MISLLFIWIALIAQVFCTVLLADHDDECRKVVAACFTGRAKGFGLPHNGAIQPYSTTQSWNFGPYSDEYKGKPFTPAGGAPDPNVSILPPYYMGAVAWDCDFKRITGTLTTDYATCVGLVAKQLEDPTINAEYSPGKFYWKAHGHACHDAAEDVGICLMNTGVGFSVKIVIWDFATDKVTGIGNTHHAQILVRRENLVCLAEDQDSKPSGTFPAECCSSNLALFDGGTIDDYRNAFGKCPERYSMTEDITPHLYDPRTFRRDRQEGDVDVVSTYDRNAGLKALHVPGPFVPQPKRLSNGLRQCPFVH